MILPVELIFKNRLGLFCGKWCSSLADIIDFRMHSSLSFVETVTAQQKHTLWICADSPSWQNPRKRLG